MNFAFNSDAKNIPENYWIASLSDGRTVFETQNDSGQISSWLALKEFVEEHDLKITSLRLYAYGDFVSLPSHQEAYWQASRVTTIVSPTGVYSTMERGIGYLKGDNIEIVWRSEYYATTSETRKFNPETELAIIK